MDPEQLQTIAARDQLWATLRQLVPEIVQLGEGRFENTDRERRLIQLLARIVEAELKFRAEDPGTPAG
jgi:hypothetical protein